MQKSTKKYLKDLTEELEIDINTLRCELEETSRLVRKLKKFYNKVISPL